MNERAGGMGRVWRMAVAIVLGVLALFLLYLLTSAVPNATDLGFAIFALCVNVPLLVSGILSWRAGRLLPEDMRKPILMQNVAFAAGFTLLFTVPAFLIWAGFLPRGASTVSVALLLGFNYLLGKWAKTRQSGITAGATK